MKAAQVKQEKASIDARIKLGLEMEAGGREMIAAALDDKLIELGGDVTALYAWALTARSWSKATTYNYRFPAKRAELNEKHRLAQRDARATSPKERPASAQQTQREAFFTDFRERWISVYKIAAAHPVEQLTDEEGLDIEDAQALDSLIEWLVAYRAAATVVSCSAPLTSRSDK